MAKNLRERKTTIGDDEDLSAAPTAEMTPAAGNSQEKKKKKNPCGKCEGEVTTKSLQCQACEIWYHDACIPGMNKEFFEACNLARQTFGFSPFMCQGCRKVVAKFNRSVKDLEKEVEKPRERVDVLELEKETLAQKVENMELKTTKVKEGLEGVEKEVISGMKKAKEEVKNDVSKEMKEREERSQNVVMYGIEESEKESPEERKKDDENKVKEVMRGVEVEGEVEIKFRAGRKNEGNDQRPRPLIVHVKSEEDRMRLLKDARKLSRIPQLKTVFIAEDMTWAQREEARKMERELRDEAERKTKEANEQGKNGKFFLVGPRGRRRLVWTDRTE